MENHASSTGFTETKVNTVCAALKRQWVLVGTSLTFALALYAPGPGVYLFEILKDVFVALLFFLVGSSLDTQSFRKGLIAVKVHLLCQGINLILLPCSYFLLFYKTGIDTAVLGSSLFSKGIVIALCMPMPSTTGVLFTEVAGGDVSVAIINASLGNILGPIISPIMIALLVADKQFHDSLGGKVVLLAGRILIPLCTGILLQSFTRPQYAAQIRRYSNLTMKVLLLVLFYMLFCEGISKANTDISFGSMVFVVLWMTAIHLGCVAFIWWITGLIKLDIRRRVAVTIMGSQKTEGKAFAIIAVLYQGSADLGTLMVPVIAYHSMQMVVAATIAPWMRKHVDETNANKL